MIYVSLTKYLSPSSLARVLCVRSCVRVFGTTHLTRVRISAPSSVMRTVCSNCAERSPSSDTTVQPSSHMAHSVEPRVRIGSAARTHQRHRQPTRAHPTRPGTQSEPRTDCEHHPRLHLRTSLVSCAHRGRSASGHTHAASDAAARTRVLHDRRLVEDASDTVPDKVLEHRVALCVGELPIRPTAAEAGVVSGGHIEAQRTCCTYSITLPMVENERPGRQAAMAA